ncbi:hypothetical protein GGR97_001762 [Wenyingzhuangia aestuarii]|nr:hypothetical protein [Wenyingzhuangia aestuarii]
MKLVSYLTLLSSTKPTKTKGSKYKKAHKQLSKQLFMNFLFNIFKKKTTLQNLILKKFPSRILLLLHLFYQSL